MGEIKLFEKEAFGKVRVVIHNGEPWFIAKDLCECLGLENISEALRGLDEDEKITLSNPDGNPRAGIPHQMNVVSESGLYSLVIRSRKPEAKAFKRWVTHEVLPSIRKTGQYGGIPDFTDPVAAARAWADAMEAKQRSALILLKRMRKPPFLDRFGGFALSRGCPDPELIAVSAGSFNEANVLEPHRR